MKRTCTGSLAYPLPKKQRDNGNWTTLGRYDVMNLDEVLAWLQSLGNPQMLKEWNASGSGSGKLGGTRTGFAAAGPADWHWLNASSGKSEVAQSRFLTLRLLGYANQPSQTAGTISEYERSGLMISLGESYDQ